MPHPRLISPPVPRVAPARLASLMDDPRQAKALPCLGVPWLALACPAVPCPTLPWTALPCPVLPCPTMPSLALACLACLALNCAALSSAELPWNDLPCPALPWLGLAYLALPFPALPYPVQPCSPLPCLAMTCPGLPLLGSCGGWVAVSARQVLVQLCSCFIIKDTKPRIAYVLRTINAWERRAGSEAQTTRSSRPGTRVWDNHRGRPCREGRREGEDDAGMWPPPAARRRRPQSDER